MIDGVELAKHAVIVVLGIDVGGQKHIGLREGATENATVVRELVSDSIRAVLNVGEGILVVIYRAKI